jgi:ribosomal protein L11 methyltransferase
MRWAEIALRVAPESVEPVSAALTEAGCGGAVIEDPAARSSDPFAEWAAAPAPAGSPVRVTGYLPVDDRLEPALDRIQAALEILRAEGFQVGDGLTLRTVDDASWAEAWKAHFKPLRVGRRFVVKPTWETWDPAPGDLVLELDPEMAFGSGAHPTTQLCLRLLEQHLQPGARVLDWGTGSGILALAAARLGAAEVLAVDLDPLAARTAAANAARNGADVVRTATASIEALPADAGFDWVVANIVADPLIAGAVEVAGRLRPGGRALLSGIIDSREADVRAAFESAGLTLLETAADQEWRALLWRRPPGP